MDITKNFSITQDANTNAYRIVNQDSDINSFLPTGIYDSTVPNFADIRQIYVKLRATRDTDRANVYEDVIKPFVKGWANGATAEPMKELTEKESLVKGLSNLINFFKEFAFEPNFRFVNTFALKLQSDRDSARNYVQNYFALMDNPYKNEISAKMKSPEFNSIMDYIAKGGMPKDTINKRFKIYFGSAGTGKTTKAQTETNGRCVVCNASMLPSDLMEDFVFADGKPSFKKSLLWECMENGTPLVLDEINLLPFDSLRFLQGILDGKKSFEYKGNIVNINDGFMVIGTMNLAIGGMTYGLPEPLVDRTADIKQFTLNAEQLCGAILG